MTTEQELEHAKLVIESLSDRLRNRDAENLRLMLLLVKNGIEFHEVEND